MSLPVVSEAPRNSIASAISRAERWPAPFIEHGGGQTGGSELALRIIVSACAHDEAQLDDWDFMRFDHPDRETVRQRTLGNRRQLQGGGRGKHWRFRAVGPVLGGHDPAKHKQRDDQTMKRSPSYLSCRSWFTHGVISLSPVRR